MTTDAPTAFDLVAAVLIDLGNHAAAMESAEDDVHDDCPYCEMTIMLSRVVGFGDQLRSARRRRDAVTP